MPRPTNIFMKFVGAFLYWLSYVVVWTLVHVLWRGTVKGMQNVPKSGPIVICPIHRSNIDGPLVVLTTKRRIRYMAKDSMFKMRWLAAVYRAMGSFPVNRDAPDRESLKLAIDVMQRGEPLVLFPEGTRKEGPLVENVHEGAVYLAMKTKAPILPVGIGNSENAYPRKAIFPRPARIAMVFGEPMTFELPEGGRIARAAITEGTERLQQRLQELYDEAKALVPQAKTA